MEKRCDLTSNDIYTSKANAAYMTACNMLAVVFLSRMNDYDRDWHHKARNSYIRYKKKLDELPDDKLEWLHNLLCYDGNIKSVDMMLYTDDFDDWFKNLIRFLDVEMVSSPACGEFASADYYGSLNKVNYYRCSHCGEKFITQDNME